MWIAKRDINLTCIEKKKMSFFCYRACYCTIHINCYIHVVFIYVFQTPEMLVNLLIYLTHFCSRDKNMQSYTAWWWLSEDQCFRDQSWSLLLQCWPLQLFFWCICFCGDAGAFWPHDVDWKEICNVIWCFRCISKDIFYN